MSHAPGVMKIVLIAAVAEDGTIGNEGRIPWHISDDLKRFKRLTMGHPIIMGRKTCESIGKPLPGRTNIVLTRNPNFQAPEGVHTFLDLGAALDFCRQQQAQTVFIIGGAEIYRQSINRADALLLTHVHKRIGGDAKFPEFDRSQWREVSRHDTEEYSFIKYTRRTP
ncbi:MAG: dihydrofolate reductase [Verrucomicrobiia bacterium]